jgi:thiol-disulfide isomerase/thioredoxin
MRLNAILIALAGLGLAAILALGIYVMRLGEVQSGPEAVDITPYLTRDKPGVPKPGKARPFDTAQAGAGVPDSAFRDAGGAETTLAAFRGRAVLLNFWATWCAPCVAELPALARLQMKRGDPGFSVIVLNMDRAATPDLAAAFLAEHGAAALGAYTDPKMALWRAFRLNGLPTTILIDAEGREIARREGPAEWDADSEIAEIDRLLSAPLPPAE